MSESEMVQRIADLEFAIRLLVIFWIVTVALLASQITMVDNPDDPRPRCPMCFKRHHANERCP